MPDTHHDESRPDAAAPTADQPGTAEAPGKTVEAAGDAELCATCGRPRPEGGCGCATGAPALPEGFMPVASRGDRPKLPMTGKP